MWQLGLGGGAESYPERPDEPDCIYYLRTGFCGYGNRCRFNHPRDRNVAMGALRAGGGEYPERVGQSVCQGEKECSYYVKTGQCKFGVTCKYHHPQPAGIQAPPPAPAPAVYPSGPSPSVQSSQQYGVLQGNWPVARPAMIPGSYVPGSYGQCSSHPELFLFLKYIVQAPVSPVASPGTQPAVGASPIYGITQLSPSATAYTGPYLSITSSAGPSSSNLKEHAFPERPGQPECQYYLRTGDCKFGATCKYHHPPEWSAAKINFVLSPMGLPLRPGAPLCSHYAQNGVCRFGPSPLPCGSTNATLAPSSSSSDLRPELLSGFSKDAFSSQMSPMNSSSAFSWFDILNKWARSQSGVHQSGQGSISSSGGSSISHGGEVHTSS
ncbi:hypothetical protein DH2020_035745 [Rehmannia glutinosa]|uniref:C3H1-type domain-containing protein n=1 Tax=Rehmannia glutinosa TaxID=99300 RepID=A0ABR0V5J6_REHGL